MYDNCFIGGDELITNVVNENGVFKSSSAFVQRQTSQIPITKCEFVAHVQEGTIEDRTNYDDLVFSCEKSDNSVCTATSLSKVDVPCLDSLDVIYNTEQNIYASEWVRTYLLRPYTTYKIGSHGSEEGSGDGSFPIIVNRPNMRVLCGPRGSSDKECVVSGGIVQLGVFDEFRVDGPAATNVLIQGITFHKATSTNVLASFPGDVLFEDCIFSVRAYHKNQGAYTWLSSNSLFPPNQQNTNLASIYMDFPPDESVQKRADYSLPPQPRRGPTPEGNLTVTVSNSEFIVSLKEDSVSLPLAQC